MENLRNELVLSMKKMDDLVALFKSNPTLNLLNEYIEAKKEVKRLIAELNSAKRGTYV